MGRMNLLDNLINPATNQVEGYCIIKSVQVKSNVKGADYLDMMLADAGGEINAKLWDYSLEQHGVYKPQTVIKVRGTITYFKDAEQLKIDRIRNTNKGDSIDMSRLIPCAPFDCDAMFRRVYSVSEGFKNEELKKITQHLLLKNRERLTVYPAALKLHHAQRGGLMFHTLTMLKSAEGIMNAYVEIYPSLCRDLVNAGIILHDIAKLDELNVGEIGLAIGYSAQGQLLGHISMGAAIISEAAKELDISEKTSMLLMHIMLSHHGVPEFGSPRMPMFPEAEIVSEVDHLDAKLFTMYSTLDGVETGDFSERVWSLDNRQLYNHGLS